MFGKLGAGQRLADAVVADVGDLAQPFEQTERLEDTGIDADADAGISSLDLLEGRSRGEGALGHDGHWQPSAATGIMDVRAELAQRSPDSSWRIMRCRHLQPSRYRSGLYVARRSQNLYEALERMVVKLVKT